MLIVQNRVFIDIKIDDQPVPASEALINTIALTEGNGTPFPACHLVLNDTSGYLTNQLNMPDGNSIVITCGRTDSDVGTVTRQYRRFGGRAPETFQGAILNVVGIYDAPQYTTASITESFKGTSTSVIQGVAERCSLQYDGPDTDTDDSQVWLNVCRTRSAFIHEVTRRGYVDDHSAMASCLTSLGVLRYKNLTEEMEKQPKFTLFYNMLPVEVEGTSYTVFQAMSKSTAGMTNNWQNYGSTLVSHSLSGKQKKEEKLDVLTSAKYLALNQQVANTVGRARVDYSRIDCSNVSSTYEKALYQNVRLLALFSERLSVLILDTTDIQLYDLVAYRQANSVLSDAADTTDIYLVVGKTVYIKGGKSYGERLELERMSVNRKGSTSLATQDPATLRDAVIPESNVNPTVNTAAQTLPLAVQVAQLFVPATNSVNSFIGTTSSLSGALNNVMPSLTELSNTLTSPSATSQDVLLRLQTANAQSALVVKAASMGSTVLDTVRADMGQAMRDFRAMSADPLARAQSAGLQSAAIFSPGGSATALATSMPLIKTLADTAKAYNDLLGQVKSYVGTDNNDVTLVDEMNTLEDNATSLQQQYVTQNTSLATLWNKSVALTNNTTVPLQSLSDYQAHSSVLTSLANTSVSPCVDGKTQVTTLQDVLQKIAVLLRSTDEVNQLLWMYTSSLIAQNNTVVSTNVDEQAASSLSSMQKSVDALRSSLQNPIT